MKLFMILLFMILTSCKKENVNTVKKNPIIKTDTFNKKLETIIKPTFEIEKIVIGDINNDNIVDTAYVKSPKFINENDLYGDCTDGACNVLVNFSTNYESLNFPNAVFATVENIGDIDSDGKSEIIVVPHWFVGCTGRVHFFTFKNNNWKKLDQIQRRTCEDEKFIKYIKKIGHNKIQFISQELIDGDLAEKPKVILVE